MDALPFCALTVAPINFSSTHKYSRGIALSSIISYFQYVRTLVSSILGAVMSSDGFFPFRDAVEAATGKGVTAIVQPGGSMNDYDAIEACNESNTAMVFSLERCFSHH